MGTRAVGLDFGTTNSAVAVAEGSGPPRLASYALSGGSERTTAFRSILHFEADDDPRHPAPPRARAGPAAIERYLESGGEGRLMQSLKSFLASALFRETEVFGTVYTLEDLVARILNELRAEAEAELGDLGERVVVGRPVRFAGDTSADELLAMERLRSALAQAGFREVVFEHEPVAAAYHYGQQLDAPEVVLIGDFGGGTSDFSLLRLEPNTGGRAQHEILGTAGVGIAGDAFDAKLVRNRVAPLLGRDTKYRNPFGQVLPVPRWLYSHLERWHHLSFLKSPRTMQVLLDLEREALEPDKIRSFVHLVREDRGFYVYRAIESAKRELSVADTSHVAYRDQAVGIAADVSRPEFEDWIRSEVRAIEKCVNEVLAGAGLTGGDVDRVFLTGGSSFVPVVRRIFEQRFGRERIRSGAELSSVASGLALRALGEGR